jgi:hypothetical protein
MDAYLKDVLIRQPMHSASEAGELLPYQWIHFEFMQDGRADA